MSVYEWLNWDLWCFTTTLILHMFLTITTSKTPKNIWFEYCIWQLFDLTVPLPGQLCFFNNNTMHAWDLESCVVEFCRCSLHFCLGEISQIPEQTFTYHLTFNRFELYMFQPSQNKLIEQFYIVVSDLNFHWKRRWTTRNTPLTMHYIVSTLNHPISFVRNSILFLGQETKKQKRRE